MKRIIPAIIGILLLIGGFSPVYGDGDIDTFMVRVDPNILILFDNSGSMRTIIFHSGYNPSTVYSGDFSSTYGYHELTSSGEYTYNSRTVNLRGGDADPLSSGTDYVRYPDNYIKWIFWHATAAQCSSLPTSTRIEVAKQVMTNYINGAGNVRLGLMKFNYDAYDGGGSIVSSISDLTAIYKTSLINSLNAIAADSYTPLAGSLSEAWRYFQGAKKCYGGLGPYKSPIEYWCQKNFVVIITDGEPMADGMTESCATSMKDNWDGDSEAEEPANDTSHWYSYRYLDDIAYYMYNNDALPRLDDTQNVCTYTIGFTIQSQLLQDTATNGHGLYLTSDNASELAAALDSAIADIIEKSYSFTSPTVPLLMTSGGDVLYQASFEPSDGVFWKGHLKAYSIDSSGNVADTPLWDAGTELRDRAASDRTIYTVINDARVPFITSCISAADLDVADNTERDKLISYVRGTDSYDDDGDGDATEERTWKLGDIFHSGPVIVGAPKRFYFDYGYSGTGEFYEDKKDRTKIILAGANDGMLHAFQASNGEELWAFIPPNLLSRLKYMRTAHTFFVDLPVKVEDVWFGTGEGTGKIATTKTKDEWRTIAIVGERQGGNEFNALDITDTTSPSWLWSYKTPGETWGRPAINRVNIDDNEVWVVIMSGGYDFAGIKGNSIYMVNAQTGTNIRSYTSMDDSAPAPPYAVDVNCDGFIDRIYLGDLAGNMYRFSVHDSNTANWFDSKLFRAVSPIIRPVYTQAVGSFDTENNLWIYFGTGDKSDPTAANSQERFIAIKEGCPYNASSCTNYTLSDLENYTTQSGEVPSPGWYIQMLGSEKILSPPTVFGGVVYFTTYTPTLSADKCEAGGSSTIYALGYTCAKGQLTNGSRTLSLGDGMASTPIVSISRDSETGQLSGSVFVNTSTGGLNNPNVNANISSSLVDYIFWKDMSIGGERGE